MDCIFSLESTRGSHGEGLCLQSCLLVSCRRPLCTQSHNKAKLKPTTIKPRTFPVRPEIPSFPPLPQVRSSPHSILSSSTSSSCAWVSKSLRTRRPQPPPLRQLRLFCTSDCASPSLEQCPWTPASCLPKWPNPVAEQTCDQ